MHGCSYGRLFLLYSSGSLSLVVGVVRCRLRDVEDCDDDVEVLEYPPRREVGGLVEVEMVGGRS